MSLSSPYENDNYRRFEQL